MWAHCSQDSPAPLPGACRSALVPGHGQPRLSPSLMSCAFAASHAGFSQDVGHVLGQGLGTGDCYLSFLPLAHIYGRCVPQGW